jgi:hypothetical protein
MGRRGRQQQLDDELRATNLVGGYRGSLVCTEQGLLVASDGDLLGDGEALAGFTSLFDAIVERGQRDLGMAAVDEVTLLDRKLGRLVIRPIAESGEINGSGRTRMFLLVAMEADAAWRRNTTRLVLRLRELLAPVIAGDEAGEPGALGGS